MNTHLPPVLLLLLLALGACAPRAAAPLPASLPREQVALALRHTCGNAAPLPLVGAFLRDAHNADQADLGLMLPTGQRLAHCHYQGGRVRCESPHLSAATFVAQCVALALTRREGAAAPSTGPSTGPTTGPSTGPSTGLTLVPHGADHYTCQQGAHSLDLRFIPAKE